MIKLLEMRANEQRDRDRGGERERRIPGRALRTGAGVADPRRNAGLGESAPEMLTFAKMNLRRRIARQLDLAQCFLAPFPARRQSVGIDRKARRKCEIN